MTGFALIAVIAFVIAIVVAYRAGVGSAKRDTPIDAAIPAPPERRPTPPRCRPPPLRRRLTPSLRSFARSPRIAAGCCAISPIARAEMARYRQIVVDIEHNAPPPLLDGPARRTISS